MIANVSGFSSITSHDAVFMRLENIVTFSGSFLGNTMSGITQVDFTIHPPPGSTFSDIATLSCFVNGNTVAQDFETLTFNSITLNNPTQVTIQCTSVRSGGSYQFTYGNVKFNYSLSFLSS
jgi:hypothetical protein